MDEEVVLLTKKGTVRKRKPKQKINYFTKQTENSIVEYISCTDEELRNKIYRENIQYAFHKLTQNIIHTYKMYYTDGDSVEDVQQEVIAFLLEKLSKYKQNKGAAYSYFGTIAKRYLIQKNKKNYAKLQETSHLEYIDDDSKEQYMDVAETTYEVVEEEALIFFNLFVEHVDKNLFKLFTKPKDQKTADCILNLFKKCHSLQILDNKKAIYIYLREMSEVDTPQITKIITKFKQIFVKLYNIYYEEGHIDNKY